MAEYEYINKVTKKKVDSDALIFAGQNGTIESLGGTALRYVPGDIIDSKVANADNGYQEASMPQAPSFSNSAPYDSTIPEYKGDTIQCRKYVLGIDSIKVLKSTPSAVNGFISKEIDLGQCSYIKLSAKTTGNGNIEYSIIDGTQETPILPVELKTVIKEKVFFGLDTRFKPDMLQPITIYRDGQKTNLTYEQLKALDTTSTYHISYTPLKSAHVYYPLNKNVKIKVVQRNDGEEVPASINSLVILRYGGDRLWTM